MIASSILMWFFGPISIISIIANIRLESKNTKLTKQIQTLTKELEIEIDKNIIPFDDIARINTIPELLLPNNVILPNELTISPGTIRLFM
jgi:hypothetical protein